MTKALKPYKKRSKNAVSYNMSRIRSKGSKIEKRIAAALRQKKIKFSCNVAEIFGKPDIILKEYKVCVFCDSEFWHGYRWKQKKYEIKTNKKFWINKIESNMRRDRLVSAKLRRDGWKIIRLWENEILNSLDVCIKKIMSACEASAP